MTRAMFCFRPRLCENALISASVAAAKPLSILRRRGIQGCVEACELIRSKMHAFEWFEGGQKGLGARQPHGL